MPANPSPAQQEASRRNGARSHGPTSEEGRARIAEAATRHGLTGAFRLLPEEDGAAFAALLEGWRARLRPQGRAETVAVEKIVAAIWREQRLFGFEDRLLRALAAGAPIDGLPSLSTVIRYRARLERDRRLAEEELAQLRRLRMAVAAEPAGDAEMDPWAAAPEVSGSDEAALRSEAEGAAAAKRPEASAPAVPAAGEAMVARAVLEGEVAGAAPATRTGGVGDVPGPELDAELARLLGETMCELARAMPDGGDGEPRARAGPMFAPRTPHGALSAAALGALTRAA